MDGSRLAAFTIVNLLPTELNRTVLAFVQGLREDAG
jgi:hypothetical protein